jgi:sterol 3beta-glucosyltransferase
VAVHHGGAGTVHAVVRAGLPSIVVPFLADQPFWGRLLARRGLGAAPVPPRRVTASSMEQAIRAAPSRAAVLPVAEQLRGEDGCGTALAEIVAVG